MSAFFRTFFLPQASNLAPRVDHLFFALLALCGAVAAGVCLAIVVFCVRYRRGSRADRTPPKYGERPFEITWTVIPFFIF
ncbi:MAG TPA: cytochrome c oxidase subunit II transmembrane domain-containing protein, partial [Chthoniobacterales bacterium]